MGVILAAGKGTRMRPFSEHWPKPILPVLGKPLMAYQLEMMAAMGRTSTTVPTVTSSMEPRIFIRSASRKPSRRLSG